MDELRSGIREEAWAPVPVRTAYIRFVRGCVELGTLKEQRFEYREWRPSLLEHEVRYFTIHPARRIIANGWRRQYAGFGALGDEVPARSQLTYGQTVFALWAPSWFVIILTATLPAKWLFLQLRTLRRKARGRCMRCGYDLRGSGKRCPECGREFQ